MCKTALDMTVCRCHVSEQRRGGLVLVRKPCTGRVVVCVCVCVSLDRLSSQRTLRRSLCLSATGQSVHCSSCYKSGTLTTCECARSSHHTCTGYVSVSPAVHYVCVAMSAGYGFVNTALHTSARPTPVQGTCLFCETHHVFATCTAVRCVRGHVDLAHPSRTAEGGGGSVHGSRVKAHA